MSNESPISTHRTRFVVIGDGQPSFLTKLLLAVAAILVVAIMLVLLIPIVALSIVVGAGAALYFGAKRALTKARAPNGSLDPRKNVRVIDPNE